MEKTDRCSGIRVDTFGAFVTGELVDVAGTVQTDMVSGERYVLPDFGWPRLTGGFMLLSPLGMTAQRLGGGPLGLQAGVVGGTGLNNIGLLVTTWGKVVAVDGSASPTWFTIDDGGGQTAKVTFPTGVPLPVAINDVVSVTGACSCENPGGGISRVVRARGGSDIIRR